MNESLLRDDGLPQLVDYSFCPDFVDQGIGLDQQGPPEPLIQAYF